LIFQFIKNITWANRKHVVYILILNTIVPPLEIAILALIYLLLSKSQIDTIKTQLLNLFEYPGLTHLQVISVLFGLTLVTILAWAFLKRIKAQILTTTRYNIYESLAAKVTESYFETSANSQLHQNTEEITNMVIRRSESASVYYISLIGLVSSIFAVILLTATAIVSSWQITIAAMILAVVSVIINYRNFRIIGVIGTEKIQVTDDLLKELTQNIRSFIWVKFDGLEKVTSGKIKKVLHLDWEWKVNKIVTTHTVTILSDAFSLLSLGIIAFIAILLGTVNLETLLLLILIFNRLRSYANECQVSWVNIKENYESTTTLLSTLDTMTSNERTELFEFNRIENIQIHNVSFSYDQTPIINSITTDVCEGDKILIQGPSGQGKSTLLKLLSGYYTPDKGTISYNNDIKTTDSLSFKSVANHIFYAANDMYVPNIPIRDYLDPNGTLTQEEIKSMLNNACLTELITEKHWLSQTLGDDANNFSLGQRQRILLSRLFSRNPSLIILDEATTHMDHDIETQILANIHNHLDSSSILIASSHNTLPAIKFNKIYEVSSGNLAEITVDL